MRNFKQGTHTILVSAWKIGGIAEVFYIENTLFLRRCNSNSSQSGIKTKAWRKILENVRNASYLIQAMVKKFPLLSGYGTILLSYEYKCLHFAIHCWRWFHSVHLGILQNNSTLYIRSCEVYFINMLEYKWSLSFQCSLFFKFVL